MKEKLKIEWVSPVNTNIIGNSLGYGLANKNLKDALEKQYDLDWRGANYALHFTSPQFFFRMPNKKNILYCLAPDTKVLYSDLTWRNAETIKIGDELIGFDEDLNLGNDNRLKRSIVTGTDIVYGESYLIKTSMGDIVASNNHRWVSRKQVKYKEKRKWRTTDELKVGNYIAFFRKPWEKIDSFDAGWLSGLFDGEGCLSKRPGRSSSARLCITQKHGDVLEKAKSILNYYNIKFSEYTNKENICVLQIADPISILGQFKPIRLMKKSNTSWEGKRVADVNSKWAEIYSITSLGISKLIATQTTTATLISNGFLSHNTMCEHDYLTDDYKIAFDKCDRIITTSNFCKNVFSNYTDKIIDVCPLGVDTRIWTAKKRIFKPGKQKFRWLYCGAPNLRKVSIMEEVWKIFLQDFSDVELYIKTTGADIPEELGDVVRSKGWTMDNRKLPIHDLVKLYHSSHAFLFLHVGEGYGLGALESMATQMPLVVSDHTGTQDFCNDKNSYLVRTDPGKIKVLIGKGTAEEKEIDAGIPNIISAMTQMANVMYKYDQASEIARQAAKDARKLTWDNSAKRLKEILDSIDSPS